jgi:hypothetical protein
MFYGTTCFAPDWAESHSIMYVKQLLAKEAAKLEYLDKVGHAAASSGTLTHIHR